MKYFLFFVFLVGWAASETITGKVVRVIDGDTVVLLVAGNKQERIRLADIDAPERGQEFSEKSRQLLSSLVANKTVRVEYSGRDMYGRILGTVCVGRKNVNEEMVRQGLAWEYRTNRNKKIKELQAEAQRKRLNIFSARNPINPYDYRRGKRM